MTTRTRILLTTPLYCGGLLLLPSCLHVKTDPIEIKPIHIVADINVKVERQLDDFFSFEKQLDKPTTAPATTAPAQQ
jgi:hypothetical protein